MTLAADLSGATAFDRETSDRLHDLIEEKAEVDHYVYPTYLYHPHIKISCKE